MDWPDFLLEKGGEHQVKAKSEDSPVKAQPPNSGFWRLRGWWQVPKVETRWVSGSPAAQSTQARSFQQKKSKKAKSPEGTTVVGKTLLLKVTGFATREGVSEELGTELMMEDGS